MKQGSILLVVFLILIAGIIVGVSFLLTRPTPEKVPPIVTELLPAPEPKTPTTLTLLETTFEKGLTWLMSQQLPARPALPAGRRSGGEDGAWPDLAGQPDVAFTALALISISGGPKKYYQTYQTQMEQGIKYLLDHVQENGSVIDPDKMPSFTMYKTSLAAVALATLGEDKYQDTLKKVRQFMVNAQFGPEDGDALSGGWGYKEKGAEPTPNANLSTSEFAMEALHYLELPEDSQAWQRAVEFLNKIQDSSESNKFRITKDTGGFVYSPVESKAGAETLPDGTEVLNPYASMTYAGLLSFIYAYVDKNDQRVQAAYNWIRRNYSLEENIGLSTPENPNLGKQGLFYYYHTFAKALDAYGEKTITTLPDNVEHHWAKELVEKLAAIQKPNGTWSNEETRWYEDFAPLATAYCLMALNHCRKWVE